MRPTAAPRNDGARERDRTLPVIASEARQSRSHENKRRFFHAGQPDGSGLLAGPMTGSGRRSSREVYTTERWRSIQVRRTSSIGWSHHSVEKISISL